MAMSSNYNSRPRAAEVLVDGRSHRAFIRRRETYEDRCGRKSKSDDNRTGTPARRASEAKFIPRCASGW